MLISKRYLLAATLLFLSFRGFAQQDVPAKIAALQTRLRSSLVAFYKNYPQEKVFVHTNQDVYSGGETIWYKLYAMAYGKPDALSNIIYVQLTDTAGNQVAQQKLPLVEGSAYGNIDINPKIKSGWYNLTAFTSWMMNFDRAGWYQQKIYIHNPAEAGAAKETEIVAKGYHISFFPEGGDLVSGNLTRVAFKATTDNGLPARVEGKVTDNTNQLLATLATTHDGLGEFTIEPLAGSSYSAVVRFPDGSSREVKLPEVKTGGISLQAGQDMEAVHLKLSNTGAGSNPGDFVLAAFQNNGLVNTYPVQLQKGTNGFDLSKSGFSTGILRLTLFDDNGLPQAERILFINKHDLSASQLKTDTLSLLANGLNSFSMTVRDKAAFPVKGSFSVSVTDGEAFKSSAAQNIFSSLLLSPELQGEVYNPGYYFENGSDSLARQLDLVMLTNGWRHFIWQKVLNNENYPLKYGVEKSLYMPGEIVGYHDILADKSKLKIKLLIMNHDSSKFVGYITPDSTGRFALKDFNHTGMSDIYLQTADRKNHIGKLQVNLLPTLDDSLRQTKAGPFKEPAFPDLSAYYISHAQNQAHYYSAINSIMLKTVSIKAAKITATEKLIAEHVNPKNQSDREFTLDLVNNPTVNIGIIDYIRGKFPGLQVLGDNENPQFVYRGGNSLYAFATSGGGTGSGATASRAIDVSDNQFLPYFYLNDAIVPYVDIKDMSLVEIALIRFMPPPVWFAPFNGGNAGAILIYAKNQSDEVKKMATMADFDHYIFNGYSVTREFAPADHNQIKQAGLLNESTTLYWNHDLETDRQGVLKFRFNNSDVARKLRVIIQGMDNQGRLIYLNKILQ